jgi:hypothetical protein
MITLSELKNKANRQYDKVLRSYFSEEDLFPMLIPSSKKLEKNQGIDHIFEQQKELFHHSKNRIGFGYWLTLKENAKTGQSEISKITFETKQDFLQFIDKMSDYQRFTNTTDSILGQIPVLKALLEKLPKMVNDYLDDWTYLLKVCHYFLQNPQPNLYVRSLPINISTKFIEKHQGILKILLDFLIPEYVNIEESDFFKRFHLQIEEPNIKIRFLDNSLRLHPNLSYLSVWQSEFKCLDIQCEKIYIIENLTTFLSFPSDNQSIAIWGGGFAVSLLAEINWFQQKKLYYWGDIDIHGFQILDQIRRYYPAIESFLMDEKTFTQYHRGEVGGGYSNVLLKSLTPSEQALYEVVLKHNWRLEQEKIMNIFENL